MPAAGSSARARSAHARPVVRTSAMSSASKASGSCAVEDDDAVMGFGHRRVRARHDPRPAHPAEHVGRRVGLRVAERATLGGLDLGRQVPPVGAEVERAGERAMARRRVASRVARFMTFTSVCSRTASTEPNVRCSQASISGGGSVRPRTIRTSRRRSARTRASPVRRPRMSGSSSRPVSRAPGCSADVAWRSTRRGAGS